MFLPLWKKKKLQLLQFGYCALLYFDFSYISIHCAALRTTTEEEISLLR